MRFLRGSRRMLVLNAAVAVACVYAAGAGAAAQSTPPIATDAPSNGFVFTVHRPLSGGSVLSGSEVVQITNSQSPNATWTAASSEPWLDVSPASGTTPASVTLSLDPAASGVLTRGTYFAEVTFVTPSAPQSPTRITIELRITDATSLTTAPQGVVDIPIHGATGLNGAVAVSGWAVDDVGISRVQIYRSATASEPAGNIYLGDAVRVRGARPDIIAAAPGRPGVSSAGWGFMILSNVLPNGGNETFTLSAVAEDVEGMRTLLGQKTVTFDNTGAPFPFGTIDFPAQGGTMSGTYQNQGWILAQPNRFIPFDGSTIRLLIDGALQPHVAGYGFPRPDVASLFPFPPYVNAAGPAVQFTIDTTQLSNGVHTIVWLVTDDAGTAQGIGSRYMSVQNASSSFIAAAAPARSADEVRRLRRATALVWDRRGFDEGAWSLQVSGGATNEIQQRPGELLEVSLDTWWWPTWWPIGCSPFTGYQIVGDVAGPLPPGASLDGENGVFRWMPPTGFAGTFELVFVRQRCSGGSEQIPLRVVIGDK